MYRLDEFTKTSYRLNEVAEYAGVSTQTIRNYDKKGLIKTSRTSGNQRVVSKDNLVAFLKNENLIETENVRRDVIYVRVTDDVQKDELDKQVYFLLENITTLHCPKIIKDIGSGDDDKRSGIRELISMLCNNEVGCIYVTFKSQLATVGYEYLQAIINEHKSVIKEINNEDFIKYE